MHGPSVMKTGDNPNVDPSDMPRKFREVFVLRPVEAAEGMQPKVAYRARQIADSSTPSRAPTSASSAKLGHQQYRTSTHLPIREWLTRPPTTEDSMH